MKKHKVVRWMRLSPCADGKYYLAGHDMYPTLYKSKKGALKAAFDKDAEHIVVSVWVDPKIAEGNI